MYLERAGEGELILQIDKSLVKQRVELCCNPDAEIILRNILAAQT